MSMPLDTIKFVEALEKSGVDRNQASVFAIAMHELHIAHKAELSILRNDIDLLRKDMEIQHKNAIIAFPTVATICVSVLALLFKFLFF